MNKVVVKKESSIKDKELLIKIKSKKIKIELENTKALIVNGKWNDATFIIKKNVEILFLNFNNGLKQRSEFELLGTNANLKVGEIVFTKNKIVFDKNNFINHKSNKSISNYAFIGFAKNNSKLLTKIVSIVNKGISQTKVKQQITCFTEDNAKVDAKPILEIHNFDSEAYHGNSIGKLNEAEISSLMTKGFSLEESKKIIMKGKIDKVLSIVSKDLVLEAQKIMEGKYDW